MFQYCSLSVFITFIIRKIFFCYIECGKDYFRWRSYQWLWRAYCNFLIKSKSPATLGAHGILMCLMWTFLIGLSRQPVLRRWIAQNVSNISSHILSITKLYLGVSSIKWTPPSRVLWVSAQKSFHWLFTINFTKTFWKIQLGSEWRLTFWVVTVDKCPYLHVLHNC